MRKVNTNFRLGLNRQQLIEAAQSFGKTEKSAKKSNTARLETFVANKLMGTTRQSIPTLTPRQLRDIKDGVNDFNIHFGMQRVAYSLNKQGGKRDEKNYLRLTIGTQFGAYYSGAVTSAHIDELVKRIGEGDINQITSDLINGEFYYREIFSDYADELLAVAEESNLIAQQQADEQFNQQTSGSQSNNRNQSTNKRRR